MKTLDDINHLKLITLFARIKTYLKEIDKTFIGVLVGLYIISLLFLLSSIAKFFIDQYYISVIQFVISIVFAIVPSYFLGTYFHEVYNSKTYSLRNINNKSYIISQNNIKYYIISKLKNDKYLVQSKNQINESLNHNNVQYYILSDDDLTKVGCSDKLLNSSLKYSHYFIFNLLIILFILIGMILCIIFLFKLLLEM